DASITLANPTKTGYTFNGWYNNAELSGTAVTTIDTTTAANIELWAKWTVRGYATNYYLYEGINNANNPTSYTVEYEDISLQAPTRGSFTFEGWYTSSAFTGEPITTIDTSQAKNLYFYAKWSEQDADGKYGYPLVLKSDGLYFNNRLLATNDPVLGGGSYSWVSSTKTLTMTNVSFTTGAIGAVTLDLSTITNVNLVLSGTNTFSTDSSSKRTMYTKGVNITGLTGKDADSLVLVSTDSGTFGNDDDVTINNITLDFRAEDDYAFYIGDFLNCNIENSIVNIQSSGSGVFCSYGSETSINHSVFNITNPKYLGFYGSTLKNINLIINDSDLSMNVGTGFYGTKLNISEDSRITVTATTQIFGSSTSLASLPDSYTWWANTAAEVPEGNGTSSDVTPYVKDTTHKYLKIVGSEYEEYVEPEPPTEYTITYNLNGGDNHLSNPATYTIEDADITLADPIKTGYTFGGWYNNFELSGTAVTTIDTSTAANIELWAKWTVDSYTATYNLNGGTNNASNPATYTIEDSYIPLSAPTKDGYIFEGWFDNADCDDERVDVINPYIHTNIELWAKWTLIPTSPTITHNSGDTTFELTANGFTMVSMSVAYIGSKDAANLDWAKFNALGLVYKTQNGNSGYIKYLSPADGEYAFEYNGYYAVYVKYVNGAGKTVSKCSTYFVEGNVNVFVKPALTQNDNTVTLALNDGNVTAVNMIYTGNVQLEINDWNTFVAEGQKRPSENTAKGYIKFANPQDASEFALTMPGYYTFYVKYSKNAESNVYRADYYTFQSSVTDADIAPTITHNSGDTTFELATNGFTMVSMSVAYIGNEDASNLDWAKFNELGLAYKTMNGNNGYKKYLNPADGEYAFEYSGYYAVYVKYVNGAGKTVSKCLTYFVEGGENVFVKPALTQNDNTVSLTLNSGNVTVVEMIYTGDVQPEIADWNTFVAEGQKYPVENTTKGYIKFTNPQDASEFALTMPGYYTFYVKYTKSAESNVYYADYFTFQSSVTDTDVAA
ncbi:MAG: InlB B-repeat-containing protein, partial [Oscillospiraceae bacterium]|nr:InlB B-repeat-containing protein [Oscillospiraceae bacterium]